MVNPETTPGTGRSAARSSQIKIHGADPSGRRRAGTLAAETLDFITPYVHPRRHDRRTRRLCHDYIVDHDAIPAPLDSPRFSEIDLHLVDPVVCHGIPGDRRLMDGDIVNIDVTPILDGFARTRAMFLSATNGVEGAQAGRCDLPAMMRGIAVVRSRGCASARSATRSSVMPRATLDLGHPRLLRATGVSHGVRGAASITLANPRRGRCCARACSFRQADDRGASRTEVKVLSDGWTAVAKGPLAVDHRAYSRRDDQLQFLISPASLRRPPSISAAGRAVSRSRAVLQRLQHHLRRRPQLELQQMARARGSRHRSTPPSTASASATARVPATGDAGRRRSAPTGIGASGAARPQPENRLPCRSIEASRSRPHQLPARRRPAARPPRHRRGCPGSRSHGPEKVRRQLRSNLRQRQLRWVA